MSQVSNGLVSAADFRDLQRSEQLWRDSHFPPKLLPAPRLPRHSALPVCGENDWLRTCDVSIGHFTLRWFPLLLLKFGNDSDAVWWYERIDGVFWLVVCTYNQEVSCCDTMMTQRLFHFLFFSFFLYLKYFFFESIVLTHSSTSWRLVTACTSDVTNSWQWGRSEVRGQTCLCWLACPKPPCCCT